MILKGYFWNQDTVNDNVLCAGDLHEWNKTLQKCIFKLSGYYVKTCELISQYIILLIMLI